MLHTTIHIDMIYCVRFIDILLTTSIATGHLAYQCLLDEKVRRTI